MSTRINVSKVAKQALLLTNFLKTQSPKELGLEYKQSVLKNALIKLNKLNDLQSQSKLFVSDVKRQTTNKGSDLQSPNDLAMFNHQIFKFNKNLEINTVLMDRQIAKLLKKYLTVSLSLTGAKKTNQKGHVAAITDKNTINPIYISQPVFQHNSTSVEISFYYYHNSGLESKVNAFYNENAKYYIPVINKLMTSLCGNSNYNSLAFVLEQYYNKKVVIKPKKINYIYNNNDIFAQFVSKQIKTKPNYGARIARVLQQIVPTIADENAAIDYNLRLINLTESRVAKIVSEYRNNMKNLDITSFYKASPLTKPQEVSKALLMFKYLLGVQITQKGRSMRKAAIARAQKTKLFKGTFRNKVFDYNVLGNQYKLNQHKSNINVNFSDSVTKYGKFNISIKSNYL